MFSDFANQKEIFTSAIELFGSTDEAIRSAASFATGKTYSFMLYNVINIYLTGNIAIGNLHLFLPTIVKLVQNDKDKRLLALHALKEVGLSGVSLIRDIETAV